MNAHVQQRRTTVPILSRRCPSRGSTDSETPRVASDATDLEHVGAQIFAHALRDGEGVRLPRLAQGERRLSCALGELKARTLTQIAAVAHYTSSIRIGVAVTPVYTRSPSVIAASANVIGQLDVRMAVVIRSRLVTDDIPAELPDRRDERFRTGDPGQQHDLLPA